MDRLTQKLCTGKLDAQIATSLSQTDTLVVFRLQYASMYSFNTKLGAMAMAMAKLESDDSGGCPS